MPGGGKGALVQEDLSATLATNQDQVLFCPIDSHPQDKRVGFSKDGTVQTLPARMGTGGGTSLSSSSLYRQPTFGEYVMDGTTSTLLSHLAKESTDLVVAQRKKAT